MIRSAPVRFLVIPIIIMTSHAAGHSADAPPGFQGYPEAPAFTIAPREAPLKNHPCSRCHEFLKVNTKPRKIRAPHPELKHGAGRFWCLECHNPDDRNTLLATQQVPVGFDDAHQLCGRCHATQHRDWYFGAHGKRLGNWQRERQILDCVRCHNPHDPGIKPRQPQPPPAVRSGLERPVGQPERSKPLWEPLVDDLSLPRENRP
jgi:hypothetical protein